MTNAKLHDEVIRKHIKITVKAVYKNPDNLHNTFILR